MADNAARNYYQYMNEAVPNASTPKRKVTREVTVNPELKSTIVPLNRQEKMIITLGTVITLVLMFFLVSSNISATKSQRQLQNINTELLTQKGQNTDLQQEMGELTSAERINRISKEQGLQLIESNIRTLR